MAIDPAPSPDGSVYFMSIEPQGFVVRRLADTAPAPQTNLALAFDRSLVPALPPPPATPVALHDEPVTPRDYGTGRQEWRSLFGGQYTAFGHTTELGIRLGDVIGRLDTILIGAFGSRSMPRGAAIASTWRGFPIALGAHLFDAHETRGIELRATREAEFPLARVSISSGGLFEQHRNRAYIDVHAVTWQRRIASERIDIAADSANHLRATASAAVHAGDLTLGAQLSAGRHLTLGGTPSTIEPDSLLIERLLDPAFERHSFSSTTYRGERLTIGTSGLTAFWQRHHLGTDIDLFGVETNASIPAIPLVKTPALQLTAGVAQVRLTRKVRGWLGVRWKP
jgi:hypothetical protein